jgi:hypothetical protein
VRINSIGDDDNSATMPSKKSSGRFADVDCQCHAQLLHNDKQTLLLHGGQKHDRTVVCLKTCCCCRCASTNGLLLLSCCLPMLNAPNVYNKAEIVFITG